MPPRHVQHAAESLLRRRPPGAADVSSSAPPPPRSSCSAGAASTSRFSRSVSAAGSTPPTSSRRLRGHHVRRLRSPGPARRHADAIAREKAGIIKPGIPVVCGPLPPDAEHVVAGRRRARRRVIRAVGVGAWPREDGRINVPPGPCAGRCPLALRGRHQVPTRRRRCACSRSCGRVRDSDGRNRAGLSRSRVAGAARTNRAGWGEVLLDAAHNPAGARTLAAD